MTAAERSAGTGRRIAGAVGQQVAARVVGTGASVATIALTTRHLGVAGYGLLTTVVVFVALWTSLTELGVGPVIVRRVTAGEGDLPGLVGLNVGFSLVYCVPLGVLTAGSGLLVYLHRPELRGLIVVVAAGLVLQTVSTCFDPVFLVRMRFSAAALGDLASRVASLVATVLVIRLGGGLVWFGAVQLAPPAIMLVVKYAAARRLVDITPVFARRATLDLLRESLPQTAVLVVGVLYWRADGLILTLLSTPRQVGAYGMAYTVAFTTAVVSTFYLGSSLSTMTSRFAEDPAAFGTFVSRGLEAMLFLGLPVAVFGAILARPVIALLGSSRFAGAATVPFALLSVAVALTFVTGALSQALFAARDQAFLLRLNVVNLAVNIAANLALVPLLGAVGAGIALLLSEVSGAVVTARRLARTAPDFRLPWPFLLRLLGPLALGAVLAVVLRGLPVVAVLVIVAAGYLAGNLLVGPVRLATVRELAGRS